MSDSPITAQAFALTAGMPTDARAVFAVDTRPATSNRRLLLSVEPLEPTVRGYELAALALATIRAEFALAESESAAVALTRAFAVANTALLAENRPLSGCRWERRVYVGVTAIVVDGRTVTIAQVPPTQAVIVQDRRHYAFPELASWRHDYVPATDQPEPDPLGCRAGTEPRLVHSVAAVGDLILLCSSTIARHLGRDQTASAVLASAPVLAGDLDAAINGIGAVAATHELDDAHVAGIVLERLSMRQPGRRSVAAGWRRLGIGGHRLAPARPSLQGSFARFAAQLGGTGQASRRARKGVVTSRGPMPLKPVRSSTIARQPRPNIVQPSLESAPPPLAATLEPRSSTHPMDSPRTVPRRRTTRLGIDFSFGRRRNALSPPGVAATSATPGQVTPVHASAAQWSGNLERYRGRQTRAGGWRVNLPRVPLIRLPGRAFVLLLVMVVALGGGGMVLDRSLDRQSRAASALDRVDERLQYLTSGAGTNREAFAAAEAALLSARQSGAASDRLASRTVRLEAARDEIWEIDRLQGMTRLGALPSALTGRAARLVRAGRAVYVLGGSLYQLDVDGGRLVEVLAPGTVVDGTPVGPLRSAAADGGRVMVTDGTALYGRGEDGAWVRRPISIDGGANGDQLRAVAAFQGSYYALSADGAILKYPAETGPASPETWADDGDFPELGQARDIVIDGKVHCLLDDGRVLIFYRGELERTVVPELEPRGVNPTVLAGGVDTRFLYALDGGVEVGTTAGRIVQIDLDGNVRQLLPAIPGESNAEAVATTRVLAKAHDLVVDEEAGVIYLLTTTDLWRASLPPGITL